MRYFSQSVNKGEETGYKIIFDKKKKNGNDKSELWLGARIITQYTNKSMITNRNPRIVKLIRSTHN